MFFMSCRQNSETSWQAEKCSCLWSGPWARRNYQVYSQCWCWTAPFSWKRSSIHSRIAGINCRMICGVNVCITSNKNSLRTWKGSKCPKKTNNQPNKKKINFCTCLWNWYKFTTHCGISEMPSICIAIKMSSL